MQYFCTPSITLLWEFWKDIKCLWQVYITSKNKTIFFSGNVCLPWQHSSRTSPFDHLQHLAVTLWPISIPSSFALPQCFITNHHQTHINYLSNVFATSRWTIQLALIRTHPNTGWNSRSPFLHNLYIGQFLILQQSMSLPVGFFLCINIAHSTNSPHTRRSSEGNIQTRVVK